MIHSLRARGGEKPTIVLDLQNMTSILNRDLGEMLYGGRSGKYWKMLDNFFKRLSSVANLVFFADGPVIDMKYDTWIQRQDEKYLKYEKIIDLINSNVPIQEVVRKREYSIPSLSLYSDFLKILAKVYGTLTIAVTTECDTEIARYASLNPSVIAVMADDSDYLIYPGQWRYFSIRQLNLETLMTKEFSRSALRRYLDLTDREMIILSTIAGNDVIDYREIRYLHSLKFGHKASMKFPAIARLIRSEVRKDTYEDIPRNLALFLFCDDSEPMIERILKSFNFYDIVSSFSSFCKLG